MPSNYRVIFYRIFHISCCSGSRPFQEGSSFYQFPISTHGLFEIKNGEQLLSNLFDSLVLGPPPEPRKDFGRTPNKNIQNIYAHKMRSSKCRRGVSLWASGAPTNRGAPYSRGRRASRNGGRGGPHTQLSLRRESWLASFGWRVARGRIVLWVRVKRPTSRRLSGSPNAADSLCDRSVNDSWQVTCTAPIQRTRCRALRLRPQLEQSFLR